MIRVMIADDHKIIRESVRRLLATVDGVELGCEAVDAESLLTELRSCGHACNLLIMDLSMPGGGTGLIKQIRQIKPELPILVLSMHDESIVASRALKAGASGYVTKDCDSETLIFAVKQVAKGGKFIDPALIGILGQEAAPHAYERLSEREKEILDHLLLGHSVTDIAQMLDISIKTVSSHKTNLMNKLEIDNNAELVRYGLSQGLTM